MYDRYAFEHTNGSEDNSESRFGFPKNCKSRIYWL